MSLTKYIEQLRVQYAKNLLTQTEHDITEIAMLVGCCNSGHFSTVFKKNEGISPTQYRKYRQSGW